MLAHQFCDGYSKSIGYFAEVVVANADTARLNGGKIWLADANHKRKGALRNALLFALGSYAFAELATALVSIHSARIWTLVLHVILYSLSVGKIQDYRTGVDGVQCPKCKAAIESGASFCPKCGAKLTRETSPLDAREVDWKRTKTASLMWSIVVLVLGLIPMLQTVGYAFFASPRQFSLLQANDLFDLVGAFESLAGDYFSSQWSSSISLLNWLLYLWVIAMVLNVWGTYRAFGMRESLVTGIARRLSILFALAYLLFVHEDYSSLGLVVTSLAKIVSFIALCLVLSSWAVGAWNAIRGFLVAFIRASR